MERRLAAILAADMVGYSRLMAADEVGTLTRLKHHRNELIDSKIAEYRGRVFKTTGDGLLAEFPSVVDAVRCAVTIQLAMLEREAGVPEGSRIVYRVGVNLGDIIVEDEDIYGNGVIVAARLETIADPGGICVSRTVVDHVRGRVSSAFDDLGEQRLKNIDTPVRIWRWALEGAASPLESSEPDPAMGQQIQFCTASDGVNIAYAVVGEGPPLVKSPNWMNLLEYDWQARSVA